MTIQTCSAGTVDGADVYESAYELKKIIHVERDSSFESIKYDMIDLVDPIRLAAVGDRYPYHTSTQGVVLYKKRGSEHRLLNAPLDRFIIAVVVVLPSK